METVTWILGAAFVLACLIAVGYRLMWLGAMERADAGWERVDWQHEAWGRDLGTWEQRAREWRARAIDDAERVAALERELDRARDEGYGRQVLPS
jgi:hypothetical protein